jgi:hypothetical protein
MTSMTGTPAKSPEQGRARKAAIGVGSQKCYRAGGQNEDGTGHITAPSQQRPCQIPRDWLRSVRVLGNVVTTALLTGRRIGVPTIGNKHTWTRMTET